MSHDFKDELKTAVTAALSAGAVLRDEFNRPGGPRGTIGHAEADDAAEHAILLGAGGDLYDQKGQPIRYTADGLCQASSRVFGKSQALIEHLLRHDWGKVFKHTNETEPYSLCWPRRGRGPVDSGMLSRAQGCLLGQLAGDSLGSLVEFKTPESISQLYPEGVRELADGGTFHTIAGQPTDDSEMTLMLARSIIGRGRYDPKAAREAYVYWYETDPFDIGGTTTSGLSGHPNHESQANGAMMRISPLGIFAANHGLEEVARWAKEDAALTHPNPVCLQANALYAMAIAHAIRTGPKPADLYNQVMSWARDMNVEPLLMDAITSAAESPPKDFMKSKGWVLLAFRNALYQLLHAESLEKGVIQTVMQGGDTDTNAAICGALLGAVYGRDVIPAQWTDRVLTCRPVAGLPGVHKPRPECFWPVDAMILAERSLRAV